MTAGETEMKWQKGKVMDSIVHHGPVGINTDRPFSALTVSGDVSVTGNIMHPSDLRIKEQLNPMNNQQQLDNVRALRLYEYQVWSLPRVLVYASALSIYPIIHAYAI